MEEGAFWSPAHGDELYNKCLYCLNFAFDISLNPNLVPNIAGDPFVPHPHRFSHKRFSNSKKEGTFSKISTAFVVFS